MELYIYLIVQMSEIIWVFENVIKAKLLNERIKRWEKKRKSIVQMNLFDWHVQ